MQSQTGQIEEVIRNNIGNGKPALVKEMAEKIVEKIKNMNRLGRNSGIPRRIVQMDTYLTTAELFPEKLHKEEFLDSFIKTVVTSFDTYIQSAYLSDIMDAVQGKKIFAMPYIQKMLEKCQQIMPDEILALNREKYQKWIDENLPLWVISDKKYHKDS